MKKFALMFSAAAVAMGALSSCDSVDESDRYIPVERQEAKRVVLIEEFTGMSCTNCPTGHEIVHDLLEIYQESVIPVSIHSGPPEYTLDPTHRLVLDTPAGQEYYKSVGSPALPAAVINKETPVLQPTNWATEVARLISIPTPLTMSAEASLSGDKKTIDITVDMTSIDNVNGKLQVWVLENGIVGYQLDHGSHILDYVHNHVLRAVVNGLWGEDVSLAENVPAQISYTQEMSADWVPENTYIVAFVYNDKGVVQATQCKIEL